MRKEILTAMVIAMAIMVVANGSTPLDAVKGNKIVPTGVINLRNTNPDVFNTTAFEKDGLVKKFTWVNSESEIQNLVENAQQNFTEFVPPIPKNANSDSGSIEDFMANLR